MPCCSSFKAFEIAKAGDVLPRPVKAGGVMIGPLGVCFVADVASNDDLHLLLTTLPSFRFAAWEVMPLIPFHRDIEMSLDDALGRAHARDGADA